MTPFGESKPAFASMTPCNEFISAKRENRLVYNRCTSAKHGGWQGAGSSTRPTLELSRLWFEIFLGTVLPLLLLEGTFFTSRAFSPTFSAKKAFRRFQAVASEQRARRRANCSHDAYHLSDCTGPEIIFEQDGNRYLQRLERLLVRLAPIAQASQEGRRRYPQNTQVIDSNKWDLCLYDSIQEVE